VKDRSEWRVWLCYATVVAALTWLSFGSLRFHQLDTHDAESFADHLRIEQDGSYFFSADKQQATGRLFADAVKYATFLIFGNDPAVFHLLVVALHMLASLLLALLVRRMGFAVEWAFSTGLFFLLNVAHFQAIHHISALDYPLAVACACAALICIEAKSRWRLLYFFALMVLAIQAHPSLATLWLLPLYRQWRAGVDRAVLYRFAATAVPIALAVVASVLLASRQTSTWHAVDEYAVHSPASIVLGQVRVLFLLSSRLLSTAHWLPLPIHSQALWELGLGIGVVTVLLYLLYRRQAPLDWAALWVLVGLFPYLLLTATTIDGLPAGPSRYLYIASAGSSLLLAALWHYGYQRQRYLAFALLLVIIASSYVNLRKVEAISHYTSARSYSARLELDNALEQYEHALDKAADVLPLEDLYPRYLIMLMGSARDFIPVLTVARARFPDNPDIELCELAERATAADSTARTLAMQQVEKKVRLLSHASNLSARVFHNMGLGFLKKGDELRATYAFEQGLSLEPQRAKTLKWLGLTHARRAAKLRQEGASEGLQEAIEAHLQKATEGYKKSLELHPDPDLFYSLGRIYEQRGLLDSAQNSYRACLLRQPDHERSLRQVAQIYQARGQRSQAIVTWERLLVLRADPDAFFALGNLYFKSGDMERAAQSYREANRLEPNAKETLANWGNALKQLGQLNEARLAYRNALEIAPENPYLYYSLGEIENSLGDANAAIVAFSQALKKGINHEVAYIVLIDLLRASGRAEEAISWEARRAATTPVISP
jgi:tetratricopeptide (TPR) repeat protein